MENSLTVANFFINKAISEDVELTPMKLVKLVYIAHGWHLGIKKSPLLKETIEAWQYGPVVPNVYHTFKRYGSGRITSAITTNVGELEDKEEVPFLTEVWNVYKTYSGLQLSTLTHQPGTPWDSIWNQRGGKNYSFVVIPDELIKKHYEDKIAASEKNPANV